MNIKLSAVSGFRYKIEFLPQSAAQTFFGFAGSLYGHHLTFPRSYFAINDSWSVSPKGLLTVSKRSSDPVIRLPSLFQSPVMTFLPCLDIQGILRFVFLLKNTTEPFSEPIPKTGWVIDQQINEALSLLLARSISWKLRERTDQMDTIGDAVRIARESLSLSHSS